MHEDDVITMVPVEFDGRLVDGAIVELTSHHGGTITAQIRIPGPAAP